MYYTAGMLNVWVQRQCVYQHDGLWKETTDVCLFWCACSVAPPRGEECEKVVCVDSGFVQILQTSLSIVVCSCPVWRLIQTTQWRMSVDRSAASEAGWTFWAAAGSTSSARPLWRFSQYCMLLQVLTLETWRFPLQTQCCQVRGDNAEVLLLHLHIFKPRLCSSPHLYADSSPHLEHPVTVAPT